MRDFYKCSTKTQFLKKSHQNEGQNEHCTFMLNFVVWIASVEFNVSDMSTMSRHEIQMNQFMRY